MNGNHASGEVTCEQPASPARCSLATGSAPTLNERLRAAGYTTEPADGYRKRIMQEGCCVVEGTAHEVNAWLSEMEAKDAS